MGRRARAYLDVNCAPCHQAGGTALGTWDARGGVPLTLSNIIDGALIDHGGNPANRVLVPGDPARSRLLQRIAVRGAGQMPPLASNERDAAGEALLAQWITVLATPPPPRPPGRLLNLAARAQAGAGENALSAGFVIAPGSAKNVLIRAVGPTLAAAPFLVPGPALPYRCSPYSGPDSPMTIARGQ